jgi:4-hydroxyphenylpyruvate dioxygenase
VSDGTNRNDNPMGTDGIEFVEYATADPAALGAVFETFGFTRVAKHRSRNVLVYRQGGINFIINAEPDPIEEEELSGVLAEPFVRAVAFRVRDAAMAHKRALSLGAWETPTHAGAMELNIPGMHGVGDSVIYLVDRYGEDSIYDVDFRAIAGADQKPRGLGLLAVDCLVHQVEANRVPEWTEFFGYLFSFREIDARTRTMASPCEKIRVRFEASTTALPLQSDVKRSEGIRCVALATQDFEATLSALRGRGVQFVAPARGGSDSGQRAVTEPLLGTVAFEIVAHSAPRR